MNLGQTEKTPVDWNSVLTDISNFATAYLGYRSQVRTGGSQQNQSSPGPTPPGMSKTTKTLLIGGGVVAAGLLVYLLTRKK